MQNFFVKLPKNEIAEVFHHSFYEHALLTSDTFKTNEPVKVVLTTSVFDRPNRLYILPQQVAALKDKTCAFSFRVGTRVFFFKAKIQMDAKGFFVEFGFELLELRRRRHVRFDIPEGFDHECYIYLSENKDVKVAVRMINFSESGVRVLADSDLSIFEKGQQVILSIKIARRAVFFVGCEIRFVGRKLEYNPELGLEFVHIPENKKSRILGVCEDLSRLLVQGRKSRR